MAQPTRWTLFSVGLVFLFLNAAAFSEIPSPLDTPGGPKDVTRSRYTPGIGTRGMVVSDDQVASEWGAEILRQGGNAVDAAVATAFALAVTRPHFASLGGGGFLLYCPKAKAKTSSPCTVIDYREKAPGASTRDMYYKEGTSRTDLSQNGTLASGVPGVPAGLLLALEKFGRTQRQKLLHRPIQIAERGYLFTPQSESSAYSRWDFMNPAARKIFGCKGGTNSQTVPCPAGTIIKQPELANTLRAISRKGVQGFYTGEVAKKITHGIQSGGGILSLQDLANYKPTIRTPLHGHFSDWDVVTMPPPSSGGGILLQLLAYTDRANKMGAFKNGPGSPESMHAIIHAMSLAFADRAHHYGDPDFVANPLKYLLRPEYLDERWKTFRVAKASLPKEPGEIPNEPEHTTHLSVIDKDGNAVALTTTVNDFWGSGFVPPGTGVVMNNQMDDFSVHPGTPNLFRLVGDEANAIQPGKRPLSSMTPTILRDAEGNNQIVIGAAGGPRIPTSVYLSLLNHLVFNMTLPDAVAAPRFHHQWKPEAVVLETNGFTLETHKALKEKGYTFGQWNIRGLIHAIRRYPNGRVWGVADPRGEGASAGE
ncbi:MAG: gamma-glutamyltransferase [Bdellovibrio sp.]|nr:gamma-glutamyltransferase [Bdellovibrio sp.]